MLLAHTICPADGASGAISVRLELILDPCAPGALYLLILMMQPVQSPHTSDLYSTRVLLARAIGATDDAAGAIAARLEPLLDLYSLRALPVLPMMQLVQSPNASILHYTRVFLPDTNCATDAAACAVSKRSGPLLDTCTAGANYLYRRLMQLVQSPNFSGLYSTRLLLARTTCTANTAARAVSERHRSLLHPCAPGTHYPYVPGVYYVCRQ